MFKLLIVTTAALSLSACAVFQPTPPEICDREAVPFDKVDTYEDPCDVPAIDYPVGPTGSDDSDPTPDGSVPHSPDPDTPTDPGPGDDTPDGPDHPGDNPDDTGGDDPSGPDGTGGDDDDTGSDSGKDRKGNASANDRKGGNYERTGHEDNGKGQGRNNTNGQGKKP